MGEQRHAGRVAIVTGAGSGIGRAAAIALANEGAVVVGCDVAEKGLAETEALVRSQGGTGDFGIADVADQADIDRLVERAASHGHIDIVANVAGIMDGFLPVAELDDETWNRVLAVNLTGSMRVCRAVIPSMAEAGRGAIVNVASTAALGHVSAGAAYTASKHGVVGLTRSVAYLYGPKGIRCNAVCPAGVRTGINAEFRAPWVADFVQRSVARLPGIAEPEAIGAVISWLASDEASFVNGAIVTADGGFTAG